LYVQAQPGRGSSATAARCRAHFLPMGGTGGSSASVFLSL
jgi:hypothetical protein